MVVYTLEQRFAKWACDRITEHVDFGKKKIIFSDEAHFDRGGYVNKQNCCIWVTENPYTYIEKPTEQKRVTVWCGFWSRGIIEQGEGDTVNYDCYRALMNEFLFTKIKEEDIHIWFQQDVATCYRLQDCIISRRETDVVWPPRSCDLIPSNYYLWGQDQCYADKPETIEALKDNIREAIGEIHTYIHNWLLQPFSQDY